MGTRPVRGTVATTKVDAPARATRTAKAVEEKPKEKAPAKGKKEELPTSGKTTKKFLLVEKVKEYLKKVNPDYPAKIFDIAEKEVVDAEQNKGKVCFVNFSENQTVIEDEYNKSVMQEVLWHYHTQPFEGRGKALIIEVIPANEENADIMVFQEIN